MQNGPQNDLGLPMNPRLRTPKFLKMHDFFKFFSFLAKKEKKNFFQKNFCEKKRR